MTTAITLPSDRIPPRPSIATYIQQLQPELARALPKHLNADRVARIALTLVRKDEMEAAKTGRRDTLATCTPESFAGALLTAAALGLEPGVNGEAFLVAYTDRKTGVAECTLIVGYQGMVKLYFQHPLAQYLDARAVHERDAFDYAYGLDPFLTHKPAKGDRGPIVAYYAVGKLTTGAKAFVVLTPEEVKALRSGKEGPSGKIPDPQKWMERKTCLRQLFKLLPKSATLVRALTADEQPGRELQADLVQMRQLEAAPCVPAGVDVVTGEVAGEPPEEPWT